MCLMLKLPVRVQLPQDERPVIQDVSTTYESIFSLDLWRYHGKTAVRCSHSQIQSSQTLAACCTL